MRRITRSSLACAAARVACGAVVAFGCSRSPARVLHDSEGRAFRATCDKSGACTLEQSTGAKWPTAGTLLTLRSESRVVAVCNVAEGKAVESVADCRALVCAKDTDCPPQYGLPKGTCLSGLCTDQSRSIDVSDAVILCFAGTGLGHDSPAQIERLAMAQQCGNPCEVPGPCRQP